jgi:hypothetical protein
MGETKMDKEFAETILSNAFQLWFIPEIERRKQSGEMPLDFQVLAAQVVMDLDGRGPVVRFNEEIKGVLQVEALRKAEHGEAIDFAEVSKILGIRLTTDDPNAGHFTAIYHKGTWYVFFDYRYNAERIRGHLAVARQFLELADTALQKQYVNAFVENLFSAVEIMAKCRLMIHPDRKVLESRKHGFTATQFNLQGKLGNIPSEFVQLLNRLSLLRPRARYCGEGTLNLEIDEASALYQQAQEMLRYTEEMRPKRAVVERPRT